MSESRWRLIVTAVIDCPLPKLAAALPTLLCHGRYLTWLHRVKTDVAFLHSCSPAPSITLACLPALDAAPTPPRRRPAGCCTRLRLQADSPHSLEQVRPWRLMERPRESPDLQRNSRYDSISLVSRRPQQASVHDDHAPLFAATPNTLSLCGPGQRCPGPHRGHSLRRPSSC